MAAAPRWPPAGESEQPAHVGHRGGDSAIFTMSARIRICRRGVEGRGRAGGSVGSDRRGVFSIIRRGTWSGS